jgi:hypothetical protein
VSGAVSNPAGAAGDSAEAAKGFLGGIWTQAQEAAEKAQAAALEAAETAKKVPPRQHHLEPIFCHLLLSTALGRFLEGGPKEELGEGGFGGNDGACGRGGDDADADADADADRTAAL